MEKRTRRVLFCCCLVVFLLLAAGLVAYAFGYSFDYDNFIFVKTGSLSLRVNTSATVLINDRPAGDTSFINHSFSKTRLLPRTYHIKVQKEGYFTWQKAIESKAGFYIDFPRVVILPRSLPNETVASGAFALPLPVDNHTNEKLKYINAPADDKTLWFTDHEIWIKWLDNTQQQPVKTAGETELITRYAQVIRDVQWYKDSAHLIADVGGTLKFLEIDTRGGLNTYDLFPVSDRFYYDREDNTIYTYENKRLVKIVLK